MTRTLEQLARAIWPGMKRKTDTPAPPPPPQRPPTTPTGAVDWSRAVGIDARTGRIIFK
jgi:hypothetical protein